MEGLYTSVIEPDVNQMGDQVATEMTARRNALGALVRDADEISQIVGPLQAATDRVGKVADHLPGGGGENR